MFNMFFESLCVVIFFGIGISLIGVKDCRCNLVFSENLLETDCFDSFEPESSMYSLCILLFS